METRRNLKQVLFTLFLIVKVNGYGQVTTNQNYVMCNSVKQSAIITESAVNGLSIATQGKSQTVTYFDGLGRPIQNVVTKGSASQKDIITGIEYDSYGREVKKYLPYADQISTTYGGFKDRWNIDQGNFYLGIQPNVDVDNNPYSISVPESSPLNRVLAQGSPGATWQPTVGNPYDPSSHVTQFQYLINKPEDNVRIFNVDPTGTISSPGYYSAGLLTLKISTDEQQQSVKEFTDASGKVILKRVMMAGDSLQTYYIYDNLEMLRAVIQPEGTAALQAASWVFPANFIKYWMFLYRYDERGRMVMKKVPGVDSVLMFYDQWDRIVLTQDSNLRATHNFIFTKYDVMNRPIMTGQINDTRTLDLVRSSVMSATGRFEAVSASATEGYTLTGCFPSSVSYTLTIYTITHYDSYSNLPSAWSSGYSFVNEYSVAGQNTFLTGQVVATQVRILGTNNFIRTVNYYDDKYRLIQLTADNSAGGKDRVTRILSFDGKVINDYHSHTSRFYLTALVTQEVYTYDHIDRLLTVTHKTANQEVVTINQSAYNELGQLLNKKIHQSPSHPNALQKLDYYYNIRGWLNGINRPITTETGYEEADLFSMELHYNTKMMDQAGVQYNGNIAENLWKNGYDETFQGYNYQYDQANRMTASTYGFQYNNGYGLTWSLMKRYNESDITYDRNGNLLLMTRYFGDYNKIDQLQYKNYKGNQLGKVDDVGGVNIPVGFQDKDNGTGSDYIYDGNGNIIKDFNKNISTITYNYLNLPNVVSTAKGTITFTYDAAGNKLQKTVFETTPNKTTNYYYAGDYVYRSAASGAPDTLEYISHPEGRLRPVKVDTTLGFIATNLKYIYDYYLKDHLGSVRSILTTEQQTDIYAATMETAAATKENALFNNISSTDTAKPTGFTNDVSNKMVSKLHGNISISGNKRVGPSIVLKVMTGDTISISTRGWYKGAVQPAVTGLPTTIASELIPLLTGGVGSQGGSKGGAIPSTFSDPLLGADLTTLLNLDSTSYSSSRPKAFLNWMVVGEDFNAATSSPNHVGALQIPTINTGDTAKQMVGPSNMVIRRNGWIYIYLSNESNQSVYFDNLVVNLKHGPLEEQKNYYAFGLENPALSTRAIKFNYNENKLKFNGKELQSKEFIDSSGLDWEDFGARMYDPQIGRWMVPDILSQKYKNWSPYNYTYDNPVRFIDPDGMSIADQALYNGMMSFMKRKHGSLEAFEQNKEEGEARLEQAKEQEQQRNQGQQKNAQLYILNNTSQAAGAGHMALLLVYGDNAYYFSDAGVQTGKGVFFGPADLTIYQPQDKATREGTIVQDNSKKEYDFSQSDEALKWIDKMYDRKFSIDLSLTKGSNIINAAIRSARGSDYNIVSHNCAHVVLDGLRSAGFLKGIRNEDMIGPNNIYEYLDCYFNNKNCIVPFQ